MLNPYAVPDRREEGMMLKPSALITRTYRRKGKMLINHDSWTEPKDGRNLTAKTCTIHQWDERILNVKGAGPKGVNCFFP